MTSKTVPTIAERQDTEGKLQLSEEFNRSLMNASPDCVKVLDMHGQLLHMNTPGLCAMEIDDFASLCGKEWATLWPAEARGDIARSMTRAVGGEATSFQTYCPTAKGTPKWWEVTVSPVRDAIGGHVVRLLAVSRDITQRKEAESALQLSEVRLSRLHLIISDPSLSDPQRLLRLLRLGIDEFGLENGVIAEIADGLYRVALADTPDGSVTVGFTCDARDAICAETLRHGDVFAIDSVVQTDWRNHQAYSVFGTEIYLGMPLPVGGRIFGTLCYTSSAPRARRFSKGDHEFLRLLSQTIGTEMTRQQIAAKLSAAEERLRLALNTARLGSWELDIATGHLDCSDSCRANFGVAPGEPLTYDGLFELIHPDDREQVRGSVQHALETHTDYHAEYRVVWPNGETRWIVASGRAIHAADGRPLRLVGVTHDFTAHKQAEKAALDNEHRIRLAMEASATGMWDWDMATNAVTWSAECYVILGLRDGEFDGTAAGFDRLIHPEDRDRLWSIIQTGVDRRERYECEFRITRPDGGVRWVTNLGRAVYDEQYRPVRMIGTIIDVTDRKQIEDTLRASEERFRSLVTATTQIVWIAAADGVVVQDSPTWRAFTGQTIEQWLGWGWVNAIHPDDREATAEKWRRTLATTTPVMAEYRLLRHDGEYRWMLERAVPMIDEAGILREWVGTNTDITDQKLAEQALRERERQFHTLAELIPTLAWMANPDGHVFWYNRRWYEYTGTAFEQMAGWGWQSVHDPDELPKVIERWKASIATGVPFEMTFPLKGKDGQFRPFLTRVEPLKDDEGRVVRWFGMNTDIQEQMQTAKKLQRLAAELSEADRRKDEFLATLAHELRNPLAPMRNGLQLLKVAGGQQATIEQARSMMERQLTQMVRLIDDLMDVSRISQGKLELRKERLSLASILSNAVETSHTLIQNMDHRFTVTLPDQSLMVDADMTRLAQVFMNLLNNAAKYSERGSHIDLNVERQGSDAVVKVRDNGIGIAADQLPHIFEMFTQVGGSLEKSQGGLGIGLTLVKRLVEMHSGTVDASSEGLGKGSEFVVRLPVSIDATQPQAPGVEVQPTTFKSSLRILVVDDNRDAADSLSEILNLMGNDTRTAYDGQQGVDTAREYRPDVIFLDIGMPKLNGYEACRLIREQPWSISIVLIALTGWGQDKDRHRTRDAGFDHHLVKPVDPKELMACLEGLQVCG